MPIRRAGADDAASVARIQAAAFDVPWSVADLRALLEPAPAVALIAMADAEPVGFVLGRVIADEAEILSLAVCPDQRRRGLARRLLTAWIRDIAAAGARTAFLEVAGDNTAAIGLYRSVGFVVTGERKAYYHRRDGTFADALMMMVNLPAPTAG